jgi:hypothetical protein
VAVRFYREKYRKEATNLNNPTKCSQYYLRNLKDSTPLRGFFQRIPFRKRKVFAISRTARKLAVINWNRLEKSLPYNIPKGYQFLNQIRSLGWAKRIISILIIPVKLIRIEAWKSAKL